MKTLDDYAGAKKIKLDAELSFLNTSIVELCADYRIWDVSRIYYIANRKNIQVALLSLSKEVLYWSKQMADHSKRSANVVREYQKMVTATLEKSYLAKIEGYYQSRVQMYSRFFPETYHESRYYFFTVKIFADPIFKKIDAFQAETERKITNGLSGYLAKALRYGPENVTVAILDSRYVVFFMQGVLSPFQIAYASRSEVNRGAVVNLMEALIDEMSETVLKDAGMDLIEKYTEVDCEKNSIIILVVIQQIVTGNSKFNGEK